MPDLLNWDKKETLLFKTFLSITFLKVCTDFINLMRERSTISFRFDNRLFLKTGKNLYTIILTETKVERQLAKTRLFYIGL